jgi:ribose/xylose/arabinose/galactoside ABC-type transport system permease subunit
MGVALALNTPIAGLLSVRSAVAIIVFLVAAAVMAWTHIGRDIVACGSDRRAATIAGVKADSIVIGVFTTSGMVSALGGVLLGYSLAAASPVALADVLAPAVASAIIGGISVAGGRGHPLGIAAGVLTLSILRSGLSAIGVLPHVQDIITGGILLSIAVLDAPDLERRITTFRLDRKEHRASS